MNKIYGVMVGTVMDVNDPQGIGRVKIRFPWMEGDNQSNWAPVAAAMAGNDRGAWFMPEVDDEVLVGFEFGDVDHPFVLGFLWNGKNKPPSEEARERVFKSKNGHAIRFLDSTPDSGNMGAVVIEDAHGNRITLSNGKIAIKSMGMVVVDAPVITLQGPGYKRIVSPNNNPI